jgi:hypothetical protein
MPIVGMYSLVYKQVKSTKKYLRAMSLPSPDSQHSFHRNHGVCQ